MEGEPAHGENDDNYYHHFHNLRTKDFSIAAKHRSDQMEVNCSLRCIDMCLKWDNTMKYFYLFGKIILINAETVTNNVLQKLINGIYL